MKKGKRRRKEREDGTAKEDEKRGECRKRREDGVSRKG